MASEKEIERVLDVLQSSFVDEPERIWWNIDDQMICSARHLGFLKHSNSSVERWIKSLNRFLQTSPNRLLGLKLLKETLRQCDTDVFKRHCLAWFRHLTSIAFGATSAETRVAALECLVDVIRFSVSFPDLAQEFSAKDAIPDTVRSLLTVEKDASKAALVYLNQCLVSYAGAAGSVGKGKLESRSLEMLDDPTMADDATAEAAKFFALLPKVGGAGVGGARHREAWQSQFSLLCSTLDDVVEEMFRDVARSDSRLDANDNEKGAARPTSLPMRPLRHAVDDNRRYFRLLRRFDVLTACASAMLTTDSGIAVGVPFERILIPLFRIGNVSPSSLVFKPTNESLMVAAVLPEMYRATLRTFTSLVSLGGRRLFDHGLSINRLILQLLKCTASQDPKSKAFGLETTFQRTRAHIYDFFRSWLTVFPTVNAGTKGDSAAKFVEYILRDARPAETEKATMAAVPAKIKGASEGNQGGKKQRKTRGGFFENARSLTSDRKADPLANVEVCCAALRVASTLMLTQGRALNPEIHKCLVEFSVPLLLSIRLRQTTNRRLQSPYSSPDCRVALYGLLKSIVLCPCLRWPPPLAAASNVFLGGQSDPDDGVRTLCIEAAVVVSNLVHPRVQPLQLPILFPKELTDDCGRKRRRESDEDKGADREMVEDGGTWSFDVPSEDDGPFSKRTTEEPKFEENESNDVSVPDNSVRVENETVIEESKVDENPDSEYKDTEPNRESRPEMKDILTEETEMRETEEAMEESIGDESAAPMVAASSSGIGSGAAEERVPSDAEEDPEIEAMLRDFNPEADPDPI